ncbi:MAG: hypothetical protein IT374_25310 [Polyangiaceae bacterium]|nr:hypothetical protein [Polyangiaceae bacterium]
MRTLLALGLTLTAASASLGCDDAERTAPRPYIAPPTTPDVPYVAPQESCQAPDLNDPTRFVPCSTGGGIFGQWVLDELGLPAYDYGLDQRADERARFDNTEGLDRRDHWFAFGNDRVNALFFNDGYTELVTQDRGVTHLNKYDEAQGNFAGGFGYLDDGQQTWSTAYRWRPVGARSTRRSGMGYAEASSLHRDILARRRMVAPAGDAPVIVAEITLENRSTVPRSLRHYEYWDVARRSVEINWLVSGTPFSLAPEKARLARDQRNDLFDEVVTYDPGARRLRLVRSHVEGFAPPPPERPDPADSYPGDPFLVALAGDVSDVYVDQSAFFGDGGPGAPAPGVARAAGAGAAGGTVGARASGHGQPRMLVMRSDLTLAPGEQRTLRFAYGYARWGEEPVVDPAWAEADLRAEYAEKLRPKLFYFATQNDPFLHRELAWHTYQVEASVGRRDYWQTRVVPQGSAYLYLHGADGAARDLGLFALPLAYTNPALARDELLLNMGVAFGADRRFSYAFQGHGMLDDAGLHSAPSDLDLFFLWGLSEYLSATGDLGFLDVKAPYYPRESVPGAVVWDHVVDAVRHLFDVVGTGEHGLIRLGTGDWSDGISLEAKSRDLAITKGESVPNTQMALAILPRVADLIEPRDAALAAEIRGRLGALRASLGSAWTGSFYGRAFFGDGKLAYADTVNLEAQVWALIGDTHASASDRRATLDAIAAQLDDPCPTGATLVPGGQVWPAISGLLTWGYARHDPARAARHLARNTLAAHAVTFPDHWVGIWSGPDGMHCTAGATPGQAWFSPVTPMTDFPVQNNNQHTLPLWAALKVAGVEASAAGLRLEARPGAQPFALRTALLDLDRRAGRAAGAYRPLGPRRLEVQAPPGERVLTALVDGLPRAVPGGATSITLELPAGGGRFEVTTGP